MIDEAKLKRLSQSGSLVRWEYKPADNEAPYQPSTDELILVFPNGETLTIGCAPTGYSSDARAKLTVE